MDSNEKYLEAGIPKEWIDPIRAKGYTTVAKIKELEKPGNLDIE